MGVGRRIELVFNVGSTSTELGSSGVATSVGIEVGHDAAGGAAVQLRRLVVMGSARARARAQGLVLGLVVTVTGDLVDDAHFGGLELLMLMLWLLLLLCCC